MRIRRKSQIGNKSHPDGMAVRGSCCNDWMHATLDYLSARLRFLGRKSGGGAEDRREHPRRGLERDGEYIVWQGKGVCVGWRRFVESDIDFDLSSVSDLNSEDGGDNVSLRLSVPIPLSCLPVHRQVDRIWAPRSISMIYSLDWRRCIFSNNAATILFRLS